MAGCSKPTPPPVLHEIMTRQVAPQAQTLWDAANHGTDDAGQPDGSKLTTEDWQRIQLASRILVEAAGRLEAAKEVTVVVAGEKIQDEGQSEAASSAKVQTFIDKDILGFNTHAGKLKKAANDFAAAADARDARKLFDASNGLDQVCEACHLDYWYPQQKAKK